MNTHSLYSASSLDRLAICPPSARLSKDIPEMQNKDAERGTRIHALGELILLGKDDTDGFPDGTDQEDIDVAKGYAEYVWDVADIAGTIYVEESFHTALADIHTDLGGTADAVVVSGRDLHIIDLKTGRNPIDAKENKQMLTYGLGALLTHGINKFDNVHLHIYQPNNISKVTYPLERMADWAIELKVIAKRADDPFEKPVPHAKACYYCKAKPVCPAMREKAIDAAKQDFQENDLEKLLDDAEIASLWADSVKEHGKKALEDGKDAGKWYLKSGRKMVTYKDKVGAEAYFAGNPVAFEIKSVSALEKAGYEVPEQYLERKISAPSLARK
jgi:hypothetical protein